MAFNSFSVMWNGGTFLPLLGWLVKVASWRRGRVSDLRPEVVGSSPGWELRRKNSGQVSYTYVPLSPSSITLGTGESWGVNRHDA